MVPGSFVAYALADLAGNLAEFHSPGSGGGQAGPGPPGTGGEPLAFSGNPLQPGGPPGPHLSPGGAALPGRRPGFQGGGVAEYVEAYERVNPHSFRKNLFQGGSSRPAALTPAQRIFAGRSWPGEDFPMPSWTCSWTPGRPSYLSEISFKGGLTGARLSQANFAVTLPPWKRIFRTNGKAHRRPGPKGSHPCLF